MELNNLHTNFNRSNKEIKDFFIIDIDNLDWLQITYIYAKLFANFTKTISEVKEHLEYNDLIRIHYSSSKSGVHIKVFKKNTYLENIYYRTFFNDDIMRIRQDILRLNNFKENFTYDIAFKYKINKFLTSEKDFKLINYKTILKKINMSKNTFYKLIEYIRENNLLKISLILNNKQYKKSESLLESSNVGNVIQLRNDNLEGINFDEDLLNQLRKILNKYSNSKTNSLLKDYSTNKSLELSKSIYRLYKEKNL